ncbi:formyltetrahydrofolate deformylase [Egicoccus halophilus]|uniref:Formyltetrahydrofolate deformylase n=1 Tax=Egicoccus halophilus TaxID=1670830 RepID=A0A8J3A6B6_9ACTN|nr:formyltetrahydrofolate deformylase [Egicoccus halophilus]GGI04112.1 formyltetrahydrofolate deformylase [Egicoccus halophilus]
MRGDEDTDVGRLIIKGPDQPGVVAAVSGALSRAGANIVSLDQFSSDPEGGRFFQRTEFHLPNLQVRRAELEDVIAEEVGAKFGLHCTMLEVKRRKRTAIMVSKLDHCLMDLLWRHRRGELAIDVTMVISNHPDLSEEVRRFGIPFFHVPVAKGAKPEAEREQMKLLKGNVDLVVLARYMQILSGDFLEELAVPIINIHHSFLPAFMGASPYQRAKERGVKLIGATAHYVTEDLDEGPIIEQDVIRVSHAMSTKALQRFGADVERQVLARAVGWHAEDRVLRDGNSTVVF